MSHICMISNQYPPYFQGGDAIACQNLSEGLVRKGYRVSVIIEPFSYWLLSPFNRTFPKQKYNLNNIEIHSINNSFLNFVYSYLGLSLRNSFFKKKLQKINPDIIHFHNFSAFGYNAILSAYEMKKPLILTLHDLWLICPQRKINFSTCNRKCNICALQNFNFPRIQKSQYLKYFDEIICPSKYIYKIFKKRFPLLNYSILPFGQSIKKNNPDIYSKQKFLSKYNLKNKCIGLFVGVLQERKGIFDIFKALPSIDDNICIIFIGEDLININNIIKRNPILKNKIIYLGKVDEYSKSIVYSIADFFLLPSHWENFPITIFEAMSYGLPIISTRVGGIPEIINENGIIIEPYDIKQLIISINEISQNSEKRNMMSKRSLDLIKKRYSFEKYINNQIELLEKITK